METTAIIAGLVTAITAMAGFFAFIMRDERARNERLVTKLDDQNTLVTNAILALGKAVDSVEGKQQLYDVLVRLLAAIELLGTQRQVYETIEKLNEAREVFEKGTDGRRSHSPGSERLK